MMGTSPCGMTSDGSLCLEDIVCSVTGVVTQSKSMWMDTLFSLFVLQYEWYGLTYSWC